MLWKDLREFSVYKAEIKTDAEGSCYLGYGDEPSAYFSGNIQPIRDQKTAEAFGIELSYGYVIYSEDGSDLHETDRLGHNGRLYEIKTIQRWYKLKKLICKEVFE